MPHRRNKLIQDSNTSNRVNYNTSSNGYNNNNNNFVETDQRQHRYHQQQHNYNSSVDIDQRYHHRPHPHHQYRLNNLSTSQNSSVYAGHRDLRADRHRSDPPPPVSGYEDIIEQRRRVMGIPDTTTSSQHRARKRASAASSSKKMPGIGLKLDMPNKKKPDFEVTDSGTFKLEDLQIGSEGMRASEFGDSPSESISSSSWNYTPSSTSSTMTPMALLSTETPLSSADSYYPSPGPNTGGVHVPVMSSPRGGAMSRYSTATTPPISGQSNEIKYEDLKIAKDGRLGQGATANVLKVKYKDQKFALKIVPLHQDNTKPTLITQEIKALYHGLSCPNIVRFYEAYHRDNSIQILLEYMDCGSLEDVCKLVGKIPEDVLAEISYQIILGLQHLHAHKFIHRDLKPSNILLNTDGEVKISDFGMSKRLDSSTQQFKTFQGTFVYMSPERLKGEKHNLDSDFWSLGVSITECAIGRFPFPVDQLGVWDVIFHIGNNPMNILPEDNLSPELLEFVNACCQVNPADRLTAEELKSLRFITKYIDTSKPFDPKRLRQYLRSDVHPKMKEESRRRRRERKQQELQNAHRIAKPASATSNGSTTAPTATSNSSNGPQSREEHQLFHGLPDQSPRDRSSSSPSPLPLSKDHFAVSPPHQKRSTTKRQSLVVDTTRERSSSSSPRPASLSRREHMRTNSYGDSGRSYHRNVSSSTSDILAELTSLAESVSTPASSTSTSEKSRKSDQHRRSSRHHNQK